MKVKKIAQLLASRKQLYNGPQHTNNCKLVHEVSVGV